MDVAEVQRILTEFSGLATEALEEETAALNEELAQAQALVNCNITILETLETELAELERLIENLQKESDSLGVELIRARTHQKRLTKNLQKLKSLNASRVKIEVSDNDKLKLAKKKTKLALMKHLTSTFVNSEDKGYALNPLDLQLQPFQLNKNKSRQVNREVLWRCVGQCAQHNETWEQLF